jgi:CubicO group peptidase (beta-lactamase class C family)
MLKSLIAFPQNVNIAEKQQRLDSLISSYETNSLFNGTILIAENNNILLNQGYGYADFSWKIKNSADTKMMLASLSKHFTANCILQLYEKKLVHLDSTIGHYLKDFKNSDIGKVTIHQLLSHTSGIKRDALELSEEAEVFQTEETIFKKLIDSKLLFVPGSKSSYSNAGYYLLSKIIESITNKTFSEALNDMIFKPVGMKNSGLLNKAIVVNNLANGYERLLGEPINGILTHPSVNQGASSIYSTTEDIFKYELSLQNNILLSKETQLLMETPVKNGWGYGWKCNLVGKDQNGNNLYMTFHNGDSGGFSSQYLRYAPDKFTVIILSNQDVLPRTELLNQIIAIINGGNSKPIESNYSEQIYKTAIENSLEEAIKKAIALQEQGKRYPNPTRINFLGNMLLRIGRKEDSKTIHKLNIRLHPKNFLGYAALGLILKSECNITEAKRMFEKILEFDKTNSYAINFLNDIKNE